MVKTIYKGTKQDPLKLDLWQNVKKVHWKPKALGNMSLSVGVGIHDVTSHTVILTINGITVPVDPAGPDDVDFGASMFTRDLRQWLSDRGGSLGSSVSINISVHGTSREVRPTGPGINAFWEWFISGTTNNGTNISEGHNGGAEEDVSVHLPGIAIGTNASRIIPLS
ncbi:hypothetical protein ABID65_007497 [Bradyrhizobium sp. S3.9.2]|uniref:hypothetical protein n=1 Tax=Bradyrhizobium sp. S3.9.2 TaxID=3156432 RepID=UPI00339A5B3B